MLRVPRGRATRPTSERVREALFSILGARVCDARVADVYAGTGAVGIEALSRGAQSVDFFESSGAALQALRSNLSALDIGREMGRIVKTPVPRALAGREAWDLIFADPPWGRSLGPALLRLVRADGLLRPGGLIVLEERHGEEGTDQDWMALGATVCDRRRYGDTALLFMEFEGSGTA